MPTIATLCDPESLQAIVADVGQDDNEAALHRLNLAIKQWPQDARIHFLRASCLAEVRRYDEAAIAFSRSVELKPDFAIARFQLGLLQLTSGQVAQAMATWAPLDDLAQNDPLWLFKQGMSALVAERWQDCIHLLNEGMAVNQAFPPLNRDMRGVIERVMSIAPQPQYATPPAEAETAVDSGNHVLLSEYLTGPTKH